MPDPFNDDPVITSQPFKCTGRSYLRKTFFGNDKREFYHTEERSAVLIIYRSGRTQVSCPACGTYEHS